MDARRHVHGGAAHPHHARTLGQDGAAASRNRCSAATNTAARRSARRTNSIAVDLDVARQGRQSADSRELACAAVESGDNKGAQILRRSYSYNDGTNFYIERWPPWRQETEYDAGLIFIAHQSDPRSGFIPINDKLAKFDMMNQFTTHVGSAIFACRRARGRVRIIGAGLFEDLTDSH